MDPVTIAIISFILTFLAAKKGGLSTTQALLAAAGVAGGSYYLSKKYNDSKGDGALDLEQMDSEDIAKEGIGDKIGNIVGGIGDIVKENPGLSAGIIAGGAGLASDKVRNYLIWGAAAIGALLILR